MTQQHQHTFHHLLLPHPDPPDVRVDFPWVHTGIGQSAQLECVVQGNPQPQVRLLNICKAHDIGTVFIYLFMAYYCVGLFSCNLLWFERNFQLLFLSTLQKRANKMPEISSSFPAKPTGTKRGEVGGEKA